MIKNRICCVVLSLCLASVFSCAKAGTGGSEAVKLETEDQKTLYALGTIVGGPVKQLGLSAEELAVVRVGITDAANGTMPQVDMNTYGPKVREFANKRASSGSEDEKKKGAEFAENVAKEKDATKTPTGIVIRTITAGSGASPAATDIVKVHYEGKLINGTIFDSSVQRGEPAEFPLSNVVPCWTQAVQTMKKGGKAQVVCPSELAYGDQGAPPDIPAGATLSFEIELLDFKKP